MARVAQAAKAHLTPMKNTGATHLHYCWCKTSNSLGWVLRSTKKLLLNKNTAALLSWQFDNGLNSLWPSNAIWRHRSVLSTAPSYYLIHRWLITNGCNRITSGQSIVRYLGHQLLKLAWKLLVWNQTLPVVNELISPVAMFHSVFVRRAKQPHMMKLLGWEL